MFRIYKGDTVIIEGESPLAITGIDPDTEVAKGEYQVVRFDGDRESERVDIPSFKTLPIDVETVTISPQNNNLKIGDTRQLNIEIEPDNATNQEVNWTSDDESVATVDRDGLVTAEGVGSATITATVDGVSDTASINVDEPEEPEGD